MKKIIFYELNEVPKKIIQFFVQKYPNSAIGDLLAKSALYDTITSDVGNLSPWVTWPTLHRGVNNTQHLISDLGQDLQNTNLKFPNYFDLLAKNKIKVGIFGSLHTFPLPHNYKEYLFYVPDTFAASSDVHPINLKAFQALNLSLVKKNGRNVQRNVPVVPGLAFIFQSIFLGITPKTTKKVCKQIASEILNKNMIIRRRSTQAQLSFDLYFKLLKDKRPSLSTFFTNHVASAMHRYWPAAFPDDYSNFAMPEEWIHRFKDEIWYAMHETNEHIAKLLKFIHINKEYILIIASSMGQAAVNTSYCIHNQLYLRAPEKMMHLLGITRNQWQQRLAMEPQYIFQFSTEEIKNVFLKFIRALIVRGGPVELMDIGNAAVRIAFGHENFNQEKDLITLNGKSLTLEDLGLEITSIQDETGAYAYHVPNGICLVYNSDVATKNNDTISTTCIAPSILKHFNCPIPEYMSEATILF